MLKENEFFYRRLHFLGDLFLTIVALYLSLYLCSQNQIVESGFIRELLLFVLPIWSFFFLTDLKTYKYRQIPLTRIFANLLNPFLKSTTLLLFALFAANSLNESLRVIALFAGIDLLALPVLRGGIKQLPLSFHKEFAANRAN